MRFNKDRRVIGMLLCIILLINSIIIDGNISRAANLSNNEKSNMVETNEDLHNEAESIDLQSNETQNNETQDPLRNEVDSTIQLVIGKVNSNQIELKWNWEESNNEEDTEYTYECYRDDQKIASTNEKIYVDKELSLDTAYEYQIKVVDKDGKLIQESNTIKTTTYSDWNITSSVTLQQNEEIGDFNITSGVVDLNGYNLIVHGDVKINGGYLKLSNGYMECNGDVTVMNSGYITMDGNNDYLFIKGNLNWGSSTYNLKKGTIELQSDLNQMESGNYFNTKDTFKVIFSGDKLQHIISKNPYEGVSFANLELKNTSDEGVYSATPIYCENIVRNGNKIRYGTVSSYSYGYRLDKDTEIDGDFVLMEDTLDLNGHTLTIHGNLIQIGGKVSVNGGTLIVDKSYRMQNPDLLTLQFTKGTGVLNMSTASDTVKVKGNFYYNCYNRGICYFYEGNLAIEGDAYLENNFNTARNHNLVFEGNQKQTIHANNNDISNLINRNTSEEGLNVVNTLLIRNEVDDGGRRIGGTLDLLTATKVKNDIIHANVDFKYDTTINTGYTIDGNLTVEDELVIPSKLIVLGSVNVNYEGILTMNQGTLEVHKNLTIDSNRYCYANYISGKRRANVNMKNEADFICVYGDFTYSGVYTNLTAGTLEVKGNISIDNLPMTDKFRTILSGDKKQIIKVSGDYSQFNILELKNNSAEGVYAEKAIKYVTLIRNGTKFLVGDETEGNYGWTLREDETIDNDLYLTADTLDLNGHTLIVKGDVIQSGGEINVNSGTLIVEGDYRIQTKVEENDTYVYKESSGNLKMVNEKDSVVIKGDFYTATSKDTRGSLTNGAMNIAGNIYFDVSKTSNYYMFCSSNSHKVILDGETSQKIVNNNEYKQNTIGNLEVVNKSEKSILITGSIYISGNINHNNTKFTGTVKIYNNTVIQDNIFFGNLYIVANKSSTYDKDISIQGSLSIDGVLNLSGSIETTGDVNWASSSSSLVMQEGSLIIGGDFTDIKNKNGSISLTHDEDYICVMGNFNSPSSPWIMEKGVVEIKGSKFTSNVRIGTQSSKVRFIFSGTEKQTIQVTQYFFFGVLDIQNQSEEGVWSATPIRYNELLTNGNRFTIGTSDKTS